MAIIRNFRIRSQDRALLNKLNASARRKQTRIKNLYNIAPTFATRNINTFGTRAEFNSYIRDVQSYVNRESNRYVRINESVVVPRSDYNRYQRYLRQINRRNARISARVDKLPFLSGGLPQSITIGQRRLMRPSRFVEFRQREFDRTRVRDNAQFYELLNRRQKEVYNANTGLGDIRYKQNYIQALEENFGALAWQLIQFLNTIPPQTFTLISAYGIADFTEFGYSYTDDEALLALGRIRLGFESALRYLEENR